MSSQQSATTKLVFRSRVANSQNKETFMKRCIMTLAALTLLSTLGWSQDGAALYKAKCAMCHGAAGEGKVGPSLQTTQLTQDQIVSLLTTGASAKKAPHSKAIAGLSAEQAGTISQYVMTLKK
jgi:cytochrome c553